MTPLSLVVLAVLAGAFIAQCPLLHRSGDPLGSGFGASRLDRGMAVSLGLILVIIGRAELFTGNNSVAMAWASRRTTSAELLRNWVLVYMGNAPWCPRHGGARRPRAGRGVGQRGRP